MVKGVIWSVRARNELLMILAYWTRRNKSKTYSIKLNELILDAVELVATAPETGVQTEIQNVRIKIVRDYLVYYRIPSLVEDSIFVLKCLKLPASLPPLSVVYKPAFRIPSTSGAFTCRLRVLHPLAIYSYFPNLRHKIFIAGSYICWAINR